MTFYDQRKIEEVKDKSFRITQVEIHRRNRWNVQVRDSQKISKENTGEREFSRNERKNFLECTDEIKEVKQKSFQDYKGRNRRIVCFWDSWKIPKENNRKRQLFKGERLSRMHK